MPNRFLLTGSVRADLEREIWPGTGRVQRLAMYPMTLRELTGDVIGPSFLDKVEIDLLAELGGQGLIAIEVKADAAPRASSARHPIATLWGSSGSS